MMTKKNDNEAIARGISGDMQLSLMDLAPLEIKELVERIEEALDAKDAEIARLKEESEYNKNFHEDQIDACACDYAALKKENERLKQWRIEAEKGMGSDKWLPEEMAKLQFDLNDAKKENEELRNIQFESESKGLCFPKFKKEYERTKAYNYMLQEGLNKALKGCEHPVKPWNCGLCDDHYRPLLKQTKEN